MLTGKYKFMINFSFLRFVFKAVSKPVTISKEVEHEKIVLAIIFGVIG